MTWFPYVILCPVNYIGIWQCLVMLMHLKQVNGVFRFIRTTLFDLESRHKWCGTCFPCRLPLDLPLEGVYRPAVVWLPSQVKGSYLPHLSGKSPLWPLDHCCLRWFKKCRSGCFSYVAIQTPKQNSRYYTIPPFVLELLIQRWRWGYLRLPSFPTSNLFHHFFWYPRLVQLVPLLLCPFSRFRLMEAAVFLAPQPWQEPWRSAWLGHGWASDLVSYQKPSLYIFQYIYPPEV